MNRITNSRIYIYIYIYDLAKSRSLLNQFFGLLMLFATLSLSPFEARTQSEPSIDWSLFTDPPCDQLAAYDCGEPIEPGDWIGPLTKEMYQGPCTLTVVYFERWDICYYLNGNPVEEYRLSVVGVFWDGPSSCENYNKTLILQNFYLDLMNSQGQSSEFANRIMGHLSSRTNNMYINSRCINDLNPLETCSKTCCFMANQLQSYGTGEDRYILVDQLNTEGIRTVNTFQCPPVCSIDCLESLTSGEMPDPVSIACPFPCDGDEVFETATGTYFDPVCQCWYEYKYLQRVTPCSPTLPDEHQFYLYEISKRAAGNSNCNTNPPCDVYSIKDRIYSSIIDDMLRKNKYSVDLTNGQCILTSRVQSASCWAVSHHPPGGPLDPVMIMHPCEAEICCQGLFSICKIDDEIVITQLPTNNPTVFTCNMTPPTFVPLEPECFAMCFESITQVIEDNNTNKLTFSKVSDFEIYSQKLNDISSIIIYSYDGRVLFSGNKASDLKSLINEIDLQSINRQLYFTISKLNGEKLNGTIGVK